MALKIQLATTDEVLNVTPDPEGLNDFELELKRSKDNSGLFYEFGVNLKFFKEGRRLIRDVYERDGVDGEIECRIFEYLPNEYKYEKIYTGQLRLQDYVIDEIGVQINIEQDGLERSFINSQEVDRVIPVTGLLTVPPKTILKRLDLLPSTNETFTSPAAISFNFQGSGSGQIRNDKAYIMVNFQEQILEEFGDSFNQQGLSYTVSEFDALQFMEVLPEDAGIYDFDISVKNGFQIVGRKLLAGDVDVGASSTHLAPFVLTAYFEHRNSAGTVITKTALGSYDSVAAGTFGANSISFDFGQVTYSALDVQVNSGDRLYLYYELDIGSPDFNVNNPPNTIEHDILINADLATFDVQKFEIDARTQFPATQVEVAYVFEMFDSLISQNSGGKMRLKSDFFARQGLSGYTVDGKGGLIAITNGHKLRQTPIKKLFVNFLNAFESFSAIYCLGWGFETNTETKERFVRIEPKTFFYDVNTVSLTVSSSEGLLKRANKDLFYTRVEVGYPKFENIGTANGVDEFNTLRRYSTNVSQADNGLKLLSSFRASSFEIESQRRQEQNTEANKLDDENFLIAVIRDAVSGNLRVETGADYGVINNIFDPSTAFNLRVTPSSFMENWRPILSSVLLRKANKSYDFTYGEGNYELEIEGVAEDRDIIMQDKDAIYYCEEYEFETGLTTRERKLVTNNPNQVIEIKDWVGNSAKGFLLSKKTKLEEKKATFILLRANII